MLNIWKDLAVAYKNVPQEEIVAHRKNVAFWPSCFTKEGGEGHIANFYASIEKQEDPQASFLSTSTTVAATMAAANLAVIM